MKTINILGDSQREQWHNVVNMLRQYGGMFTDEARSNLCDELDRYIDAMEDLNEQTDEKPAQTLCDRDGNAPRSVEEQEDLVRWAVRNSAESYDAISSSDWDDKEDIEDFKRIIFPRKNIEQNISEYWAMDTLARDVFCDIIEGVKK